MENKKGKFDESELSEFAQKVLLGMRKAIRKLVEERAALGQSLVFSEDGEVKHVPAKNAYRVRMGGYRVGFIYWEVSGAQILIKNGWQKGACRIVIQSLTH